MPPLLALLRPHQWAKNLLAFVGLLAAHRWMDGAAWQAAAIAFAALCCTASAIYILNDALDVANDRLDPDKRHRPLAAGTVSPRAAALAALLLVVAAGLLIQALPALGQAALLGYAGGALAYNLGFKRVLWLDVMLLSALYTLRVIAGALACSIAPSPWLVAFSLFLFLSLAALKRYAELARLAGGALPGRPYRQGDGPLVMAIGVAAALAAGVVLALYVNAEDVSRMYRRPELLWALGPIVLTWLARIWTTAHRGELRGDPVLHALGDRGSWVAAAAFAACILIAS